MSKSEYLKDLDLIDERLLPPQIRELVVLIGMAETLALLSARGGTPLYFAENPSASQLHQYLKPESVEKLAKHYGRERMDLPKADKLVQQLRNHYIQESRERGLKSGRQLARELNLSWRWIKCITKGRPKTQHDDARQRSLFSSDSHDNDD